MNRAMFIAGFVILAAGPVRAGLVAPLDPITVATNLTLSPGGHGTMGILNATGSIITSDVMFYPNPSDVITVTFGIHWPYTTPVLVERNRNGLVWDTTEVALLGAGPAGPFVTNNIGTTPAAAATALNAVVSPLSGTESVRGIEQFPASPFVLVSSSTIPFFRVTFRAQDPFAADGLLDLLAPSQGTTRTSMGATQITTGVGLIFRTFTTTLITDSFGTSTTGTIVIIPGTGLFITGGGASTPTFGLELVPEPASASLLGAGLFAIASGAWQRRRRFRSSSPSK